MTVTSITIQRPLIDARITFIWCSTRFIFKLQIVVYFAIDTTGNGHPIDRFSPQTTEINAADGIRRRYAIEIKLSDIVVSERTYICIN